MMLSTHSSTARLEISLASRNATLHSVAWLPRTASADATLVPVYQLVIIWQCAISIGAINDRHSNRGFIAHKTD